VYEWAAFLVCQNPMNVRMCADMMLRGSTVHLYTSCLRGFSVAAAECFNEEDRPVLLNKIDMYYTSVEAFEKFVRGTAIALLARCAAVPAGRSQLEADEVYSPWAPLAQELGFARLVDVLEAAEPGAWKEMTQHAAVDEALFIESIRSSPIRQKSRRFAPRKTAPTETQGASVTWQGRYQRLLDLWFEELAIPVLDDLRRECVRPEHWYDISVPEA